jgi:plasmid stabilization system protein ParE
MSYRVILQPEAERDIRRQAQWIAERSKSPAKALRWVRAIRSKIDRLKVSPSICPVDPDSVVYGEEVRVLLFGNRHQKFRILFVLRGDLVRVLTVRHAARRSLTEEMEENDIDPGN